MEVQASSAMASTHHALRELRLPGLVCRTYGPRPRPQQRLMSQTWIPVYRPTSLHNLIWYYERGSDAFVKEWKDITISWYVQLLRQISVVWWIFFNGFFSPLLCRLKWKKNWKCANLKWRLRLNRSRSILNVLRTTTKSSKRALGNSRLYWL